MLVKGLQLIPSENFTSVSVMQAVGSVMTNTVRYIDMAQSLCQKRALEAFRLDPAKWGGKYVRYMRMKFV